MNYCVITVSPYTKSINKSVQTPLNVGILGSRIPRKVLESEEGLRLKGNEAALRSTESASTSTGVASKDIEQSSDT